MRRARRAAFLGVLAAALALAAAAAGDDAPITGVVQDAGGEPVAGARVELFAPRAPWREWAAELAGEPPAPDIVTRTGPDGRFELFAPAGLWRLEVTAPGHWRWRHEVAHDGVGLEHAPIDLERDPGLELTVVDAAGQPISGARVAVRADDPRARHGGAASWRGSAGEDGRARPPRQPERRLVVGAVAPGFAPGRLEVPTGQAAATLRLEPGVAWSLEVRDRWRRPVAGAVIATAATALPLAVTGDDGRAEVRLAAEAETRLRVASAAGSAVVTAEPPRREGDRGGSTVGETGAAGAGGSGNPGARQDDGPGSASAGGAPDPAAAAGDGGGGLDQPRVDRLDDDASDPTPTAVTAPGTAGSAPGALPAASSRRIVVTLEPTVALDGRVLAQPDRLPLPGALVWVSGRPDLQATTGPRGAFSLPLDAELAVGALTVIAAAPGHGRASERLPPVADDAVLMLAPLAAVSGRVVDPEGRPVAGARLIATPQSGWRPGSRTSLLDRAVSGADGGFRLARLTPDVLHLLLVQHPEFASAELDVTVPPAGRSREEVEVVLDRGTRASGIVFGFDDLPLAGATAVLLPPRGSEGLWSPRITVAGEPRPPSAVSDAEGRFVLERVTPGPFDLVVTAPGHAPLRVPGVEVAAPPAEGDLGSFSLERGAEVTGRVADAEGAPVAGAEVRAIARQGLGFGRDAEQATAKTGADGRFVLPDLAPEVRVDLAIAADGFAVETLVDVVVPPERPLEVVLERSATLAGRLVDGSGAGIAGGNVHAMSTVRRGRSFRGVARPSFATTDDDGAFVLEGVPPGEVRVLAAADDFQPAEALELELAPGERREGLRLVLERGGVLTGRVTGPEGQPLADVTVEVSIDQRFVRQQAQSDGEGRYRVGGLPPELVQVRAEHPEWVGPVREATIGSGETRLDLELRRGLELSGRVVDDAGGPVAGAEVSLVGGGWGHFSSPVRSGDDGSFRIDGVEPGSWGLAVTREGLAQMDPEARFEVTAPLAGIEVRMTAGGAIVGEVRGLELAELARLRLFAQSGNRQGPPRSGSVDFEGGYRIEGVGPGAWRVVAILGGEEGMASGEVELAPGQAEARLDLEFAGDLVLSGRVTLGGDPVAGAEVGVSARQAVGFGAARTSADGTFRIARLNPGTYLLFVHGDGVLHQREIELAGDQEVRIDLEVAEVSGRVVDAETRAPVAGAEVELLQEVGGGFGTGSRDRSREPDGAFRLTRVTAGDYLLRVHKEGYGTASRPLTVDAAAGVAGLEVALEAAAGAVLELAGPFGVPPPRVNVVVLAAAAGPPADRTIMNGVAGGAFTPGEGGRLRLTALPPGRWRVLVAAPGAAVAAVELTAPGPPVAVQLLPEAIVEVTVRGIDGAAVPGRVRLLAADGRPLLIPAYGALAQAEWPVLGTARIAQVPAGTWIVEVTLADDRVATRPVAAVAGSVVEVVVE